MAIFVAPLHFDKSMIITDLRWPQSPYPAHRPDVPSHWFIFLIALNICVLFRISSFQLSVFQSPTSWFLHDSLKWESNVCSQPTLFSEPINSSSFSLKQICCFKCLSIFITFSQELQFLRFNEEAEKLVKKLRKGWDYREKVRQNRDCTASRTDVKTSLVIYSVHNKPLQISAL